jgi:hypothetical protein
MHQEQKASSYYVLLEYMKALNDYQYSWMRTKVVISWWLKALLSKFQCLLLFFSEQHPILLDQNGVHNRDIWKKGQCNRNRKLAAIMCSWNMRRLWTTISAVEWEQRLSLVDDWRHCCHCSWLKRRGTTSMERRQVVFPARACTDVPFPLLKLNIYSNRFMSRATSPLLLSTSFW